MTWWYRLPLLLLPLLAAHAIAGNADSSQDSVKWRCWYDNNAHIICLIDKISDVAMLDGLPRPVPSIAQAMGRDYGVRRKFFIHIPLHSFPSNRQFAGELAKNTVCGSRPDCDVQFTMEAPSDEEIEALLSEPLPESKPDKRPLSNASSSD